MLLTGAQIIMECFLEQGVDTVFGYPGGSVLNVYDALYEYRDRIRHITTAHEQAASHAADGYARASGKTGVCIATSGPGATNLVTGIATAYADSSPVVAITGNVNRDLLGKNSFQEVDIASIVRPVTKKSCVVMKVEELAQTIREAFRIANEGRKGPVLIDVPKDVTAEKCEYSKSCQRAVTSSDVTAEKCEYSKSCQRAVTSSDVTAEKCEYSKSCQRAVASSDVTAEKCEYSKSCQRAVTSSDVTAERCEYSKSCQRAVASSDVTSEKCEYTPGETTPPAKLNPVPEAYEMQAALSLLAACKRPFLYTGGGVIAAEAAGELFRFAAGLDAPVSSSLMCQGGYDQADPRYIGMLGMHGTMVSSLALRECDLFVAVGTRFSDRVTCNAELFARHCPIIQIDIDRDEFNKNVMVDVCLQGDVREVLSLLNEQLPAQDHRVWMERIAGWQAEYPPMQGEEGPGVMPAQVLHALAEVTEGKAILSTEVGQHQMWAAQYYAYRFPRQLITSGGLGTMGFGLGAAIGAKLACPEKTVVNIAGDGSFHMNANELSTLSKYQIPVVELLFNNQVLGMVRQWQKLFYGNRFSETTLEKPTNYEALARAYGVEAMTIRTPEEIMPVLREAVERNAPVLVNCIIGMDVNVLPMVPAGGSVEEPILSM